MHRRELDSTLLLEEVGSTLATASTTVEDDTAEDLETTDSQHWEPDPEEERARVIQAALFHNCILDPALHTPRRRHKSTDGRGFPFVRFLTQSASALAPLTTHGITPCDRDLDPRQREAVARAIETRDLFLLAGHPGSGKSRVLAEIVRQAARRGERVLLLGHTPASLDSALRFLAESPDVLAVRLLDREESPERLRDRVRHLELSDQVQRAIMRAREAKLCELVESQRRRRQLEKMKPLWPALEMVFHRHEQLDTDLAALAARRGQLKSDLGISIAHSLQYAAAGNGFACSWNLSAERERQALAELDKLHDKSTSDLTELREQGDRLEREFDGLRPLLDASRFKRFWSPTWWQSLVRRHALKRAQELEVSLPALREREHEVEGSLSQLQKSRAEIENTYAAERQALIQAEHARLEASLDDEYQARMDQAKELARHRTELGRKLGELDPPPDARLGGLFAARRRWQECLRRVETASARAKRWVGAIEEEEDLFRETLLDRAHVVAASRGTYLSGRHGLKAHRAGQFDLVILEEADDLGLEEATALVCGSQRCILVGNEPLASLDRETNPGHGVPTAGKLFHRLWVALNPQLRSLPYTWHETKTGLVCTLHSIPPESEPHRLEVERLADYPSIFLNILTLPGRPSVVARVQFPPHFPIERAKQFIFRELDEFAAEPLATRARWVENADRVVLQFARTGCVHQKSVELAQGIQEHLEARRPLLKKDAGQGISWQTCCVQFERAHGWHRAGAEEWTNRHLGFRDCGRAMHLESLHRPQKELAELLQTILAPDQEATSDQSSKSGASPVGSFAFIAVSGPSENASDRTPRRTPAPKQAGGAGLELDMADANHRNRLAPELKAGLPENGYVNLAEAKAVVRYLADNISKWARPIAEGSEPEMFVIATYQAQADLIRKLVQQSPALTSFLHAIEVGVPDDFLEREAATVLISLTRSQKNRATPYGSGAPGIITAITRARLRLCVFGDPGTLARRLQWDGALDHLDVEAARQEGIVLSRLTAGALAQAVKPPSPRDRRDSR